MDEPHFRWLVDKMLSFVMDGDACSRREAVCYVLMIKYFNYLRQPRSLQLHCFSDHRILHNL